MNNKIIYKWKLWKWKYSHKYHWWQREKPHQEFSTRIYSGLPGSGKTLKMVEDCIALMRKGVVVYSNLTIIDPEYGHRSRPLGSWLEMLRASVEALEEGKPTVFAIDEIHLMCDARNWSKTPGWWLNLIAQRRHYGVGIIGTTQAIDQVEKRLRTLVDFILEVHMPIQRGWFLSKIPIIKKIPLMRVNQIDARVIDNPNVEEKDKRFGKWVLVSWLGYHGYSTQELMASDDFIGYKEDDIAEEINILTQKAINLAVFKDAPVFAIEIFGKELLDRLLSE